MAKYYWRILFSIAMCSLSVSSRAEPPEVWLAHINYPGAGDLSFYLFLETGKGDSTFEMYSDPKGIYTILHGFKKAYVALFSKGYKGAILTLNDGVKKGDTYSGHFTSYLGRFDFKARGSGEYMQGNLIRKKDTIPMLATRVTEAKPVMDYPALADSLESLLQAHIYNPQILDRKDWKKFRRKFEKVASRSLDDLDLLMGFFVLKNDVATSHFYLLKNDPMAQILKGGEGAFDTEMIKPGVALMTVRGFMMTDTSRYKTFLDTLRAKNLVIDLRQCPGGDFSSIKLAQHFIDSAANVGYFLGNRYYKDQQQLPGREELLAQKPFAGNSLEAFFGSLDQHGILVGRAEPEAPRYKGRVMILTSRMTASAAEPFVEFMKEQHCAEVIGENTAGAMLSAKTYPLPGHWFLALPVADYFTFDNKYLDQVGVTPDLDVPADQALEKALSILGNE